MAWQIAGLIKKEESVQEIILDYVNSAKAVYKERQSFFDN